MNIQKSLLFNKNINSKTIFNYSNIFQNKNRCLSNSLSMKQFSPNSIDLFDREKMEEEMSQLIKEIKQKTKEYQNLKNAHNQMEEENIKTMKIIETLISDCQKIQSPIERQNFEIDNGNKSLVKNLQQKLDSYNKELTNKTNQLNNLKTKNAKVLRLFEIENKLKDAKEQLNSISKEYNCNVIKMNDLDNESHKASEQTKILIATNHKLKHEIEEVKNKIKFLENENEEMLNKEKILDEKNKNLKDKISEIKFNIKEKENEIDSLKDKINEFKELTEEKNKNDIIITSQIKQINLLKEQNDKKSRKIKDLEKQKLLFEKELEEYENKTPKTNLKLPNLLNEKKQKEEELNKLKIENEKLKKEIQKIKETNSINKQVPLELNTPLKLV